MIEVELKARVRDRAAALTALSSFARAEGEVDKSDEYWRGPEPKSGGPSQLFRIRSQGGDIEVNFKAKRREGGLEVNRESEFGILGRETFVELIKRLGCEPTYTKRKRGQLFSAGGSEEYPFPASLELIEVEGLGDFIEIEILLEVEEPAMIARAQAELRALLARSLVSESDLEPRFYSELLAEAGLAPRSVSPNVH